MADTTDSIITEILTEEGPGSNDPKDKGGQTAWGISKVNNPQAWKNGPPTQEQARQIYLAKYVQGPGFDQIKDPHLQAQMVDFGVNSGPGMAIMKLQTILGITIDGVLGPQTLEAANNSSILLNNELMLQRMRMIARLVQKDPTQLKFLVGWIERASEFMV